MDSENPGRTTDKKKIKVYLIGSLRNPDVPKIAQEIRNLGFDVFDDWFAAGPEADDKWRDYERDHRGHTFAEGLQGYAAKHVYNFDKTHLLDCDIAVLYMPSGKSAHLELGWVLGIAHVLNLLKDLGISSEKLNLKNKKGYIVLDGPERWDVMYQFADGIFSNFDELKKELKKIQKTQT